ncbi:MAG: serine hydrolase domain-containing protein [Actinomycetota bacterium]
MSDLADLSDLIADWPSPDLTGLAVTSPTATLGLGGDTSRVSRIASISKISAALAAMVAVEEGTITVEDPAGPPGSTVRHLLAHAAGYAFDGPDTIATVGSRRIYSNTGIEVFADHLARAAGMPYETYQREAVFVPLGMANTRLEGSPAHGVHSNVDDLLRLARELLSPTLVTEGTFSEAVTPQFPDLAGVIPGFGRHDPSPWGLGIEIRGDKQPHWTARDNSPRTFGHFGGTGTYLWVDPDRELAAVAISGVDFDSWAAEIWPRTNQTLLDRFG